MGARNIADRESRNLFDLPAQKVRNSNTPLSYTIYIYESIEKVLALEQRILGVLALIRSARNLTVAVNRLPPEVLAKILGFRHDDRDLISATHVCGWWRSILLSTPLLWTEVVFGGPDRTLTYLERSKLAPLRVSIWGSAIHSSTGDMSWIGRMNSLCISGDKEQIESTAGQLCLPAPLLQSLAFSRPPGLQDWTTVGHSIHIPPAFLAQRVPSLRNLAFLSISPSPVTGIPLQNLTNLRWTNSMVVIGELLTLLESAPLLEVIILEFGSGPASVKPRKFITLSKLRKLIWVIRGRFSLMRFIIAPELNDLSIRLNYSHILHNNNPSIILPPHQEHVPLLTEPTALRYVCHDFTRTWNFTYPSGRLTISESPEFRTLDPPVDRWLAPSTPISFRSTKRLVVEGFNGFPLPGNIPIEQFESLEYLKLVGEVDRLLKILQPNGNMTNGTLPVPFLSHLELRPTLFRSNFPFVALVEILRQRKVAGHGVKSVRIAGEYGKCPSGLVSRLTKLVDVLTLD